MNKIVRATAGAGKTTGLLDAVYQAYQGYSQERNKWPRVLLSTFTVKAANELYERLVKKAVDLKNPNFLDYVSSNFLEVGTLHSVFLKVFEQVKSSDESIDQNRFSSLALRHQIGRALLHGLIEDMKIENFFYESRAERDLLNLFNHVYENADNEVVTATYEELLTAVHTEIKNLLVESDASELYALWEKTKDMPALLNQINELDTKEQKKLKKIKTFLLDSGNSEVFLKNYSKKHKIYRELYKRWSLKVKAYLEESHGGGLLDAEVRLYEKLKEQGYKDKLWEFCFFDEYQDTSPIQKKIIDIVSARSKKYFVGDPYQSIYFFRGARKEIFLREFEEISKLGGETEYRLNNYRSAPEIVDFANGLTKYMLPDFIEMEPFIKDVEGAVKLIHFPEGKIPDEVNYIKNELKKIDLEKESVAVLSRGSKELLLCGKILRQAGIPHKVSLSKGFESSLEIIELVSFLKFLCNPHDDENVLVLLMSPWVRVSDIEIQETFTKIKTNELKSFWEQFSDKPELEILMKSLENSNQVSSAVILADFVGSSNFLDSSVDMDPSGERESNILKLIAALESEESKKNFNVLEFCDDILSGAYRFESEEVKSETGCLLMTVHGSKGLQFDHVFLLGLNKSNVSRSKSFYFNLENNFFATKDYAEGEAKLKFPFFVESLSLAEKDEMNLESLRLFYVAMTRAKKSLFLLGSKKISKTAKNPSWFSLALDYSKKMGKEKLLFEMESEDSVPLVDSDKREAKGFLLDLTGAEFLNKKSFAVTGTEKSKEYDTGVDRLFKMSDAIKEGVLFHELMEKVSDVDAGVLKAKEVFGAESSYHEEAVKYLFAQTEFPFPQIITQGEKEWGFDLNSEVRISGKIDLWAKIDGIVWIVDYKTGQVESSEKGFNQLEVYKGILSKYLKGKEGEKAKDLKYNLVLSFPYDKKNLIKTNI